MKQEQKSTHDKQKTELQGMIDAALQAKQQGAEAQKQREQNDAQAQESDKTRQADSASKLIDIVWEKKKGEDEAVRGQQQEEMKSILSMIQDNSRAQNEAILKMIEASLAERETEVSERDAKGKVKKTVSRVKKK
jgi:hypothetical protein